MKLFVQWSLYYVLPFQLKVIGITHVGSFFVCTVNKLFVYWEMQSCLDIIAVFFVDS